MARGEMDTIKPVATTAHGPLPAYRELVAAGELTPDPSQALAAERLQALWVRLRGYDPPAASGERPRHPGMAAAAAADRGHDGSGAHGLYLVGEVGRGKSMMMDLFFAAADVARKQRIHFHRFMQDVHARFHAWKRDNPDGEDPIPPLGRPHRRRRPRCCASTSSR